MTFFIFLEFSPQPDPKFSPNKLKIITYSHESYRYLLERSDKPCLLIFYLIPYHYCWKLPPKCLFIFFGIFWPKFWLKIFPKFSWNGILFALMMPLLSGIDLTFLIFSSFISKKIKKKKKKKKKNWNQKCAKTIGNSYFCPINHLLVVWKSAIMDFTHGQVQKKLMDRKNISFQKVFFFANTWGLIELYMFLYNEWLFTARNF